MDAIYPVGPNGIGVFLLVTVVLAGAAAMATGRAIALTWQPIWKLVVYVALLTFTARFFHYALFRAPFLTVGNVVVDLLVVFILALIGHRLTRTRQMAQQYPWLFQASGPLAWKPKRSL